MQYVNAASYLDPVLRPDELHLLALVMVWVGRAGRRDEVGREDRGQRHPENRARRVVGRGPVQPFAEGAEYAR